MATADKVYGLEVKATASGMAVFDEAGKKLETVAAKQKQVGEAGEIAGKVVKKGADMGADALKGMAAQAVYASGKFGQLSGIAAGMTFKAVEEGLETVGKNALAAAAGVDGVGSKIKAMAESATGGAVGLGLLAAAVAGTAYKMHELAAVTKELNDQTRDNEKAFTAAKEPTSRQTEQLERLAKVTGMTVAELQKFKSGSGAEGLAAIFEVANKNPAGIFAKGLQEVGDGAQAARQAIDAMNSTMLGNLSTFETGLKKAQAYRDTLNTALDTKTITQDAEALSKVWDEAVKRTGNAELATKLYGGALKDLSVRAKDAGMTLGADLLKKLETLSTDTSVQDWLKKITEAEKKFYAERKAANASYLADMIAAEAAANAKIVADHAQSIAAINAQTASRDISGGEDAEIVNVDRKNPVVAKLLAGLKDRTENGKGGVNLSYLTEAAAAIKAGNLTALENLVKASAEQATVLARIPGSGAAGIEAKGISQQLSQILQQMRSLFSLPGRASGGPVTGGEWYMVNEGRPGPWKAPADGVVSPSRPSSGFGGSGSASAVNTAGIEARLDKLAAAMDAQARRPVFAQISQREVAHAAREGDARGNAGALR